ncbi:hypothetical protein N0V90_010709 [Kalmusia sp. IMI 367209]|nr:hypothetical protein N0V90_010709 [Kalmusia sp. IMI 367209]
MQFSIIATLLAVAVTTSATAIPNPDAISSLAARDGPAEGNATFPSSEFTTFSAQFGGGVEGTLYWRFTNANTFQAKNVVKDTKGDSHSVFMTTVVYDGGDNVLRCQNGKGVGHTVTCDYRSYHRTKKIVAIAPKWCVDIQLGSDDCLTGPRIGNPYA